MNGTHQVLTYADDMNLIERNAEVLLNACKNIGLAINIGKTNYIEVRWHMLAH